MTMTIYTGLQIVPQKRPINQNKNKN